MGQILLLKSIIHSHRKKKNSQNHEGIWTVRRKDQAYQS